MVERRLLFEITASYSACLGNLDLRAVQRAFATLMDQAAEGVQSRRLDLDEVLLERAAQVVHPRAPGRGWMIPVSALTDPRPWLRAFDEAAGQARGLSGAALPAGEAQVVALRVEIYRELGVPLVDFRDPPGRRPE